MKTIAALVWLLLALPGVAAAAAPVMEVLIDRRADSLSVYVALPAEALVPVFGMGAEALLGADGTVDIEGLFEGTYPVADDIFAGAALRLDGREVPVEALSMMLHDPAFLPDFADPYDAQMSIAVCTSPETVRGMGLPELRAYLGWFAWKVDGMGGIEIDFPATGRPPVTVTVRDFSDFREVGRHAVTLADGGVLRLPPAGTGLMRAGTGLWAAAIGTLALTFIFVFSYVLRAGSRRSGRVT